MEDLLQDIIKEAKVPKLQNLKQAAQIAHDKLIRQHGNIKDPSYVLRQSILMALKIALDEKKFISVALNGMHRLIRDERFFLTNEPEDDTNWLPSQLLKATNSIMLTGSEETVVNVLRLFLSMGCSEHCTLNGRILIDLLQKLRECYENFDSKSIKAASLATASQCLRVFVSFLKDEADELNKAPLSNPFLSSGIYNECLPVMSWLIRNDTSNSTSPKKSELQNSEFILECILTLVSSLPKDVSKNPHFITFLWKSFCPVLIQISGIPQRIIVDKKFTYKDAINMIESENKGFFIRQNPQGRLIFLIAIQLVRIAPDSLRATLEAIFHRMLLLPNPSQRVEPLKCVRELFKSPARLVDMTVLINLEQIGSSSTIDDMELIRLFLTAMEEVVSENQIKNEDGIYVCVECILALLGSIKFLISSETDQLENIITDQVCETINNRFPTIWTADYSGPIVAHKLSVLYRQSIGDLKFEGTSESESDNENNDNEVISNGGSSTTTEGPEENQSLCDDSSNWLYSHLDDNQLEGENDRKHAKDFFKILVSDLVPKLLKLRTSIEIDEAIQEFASNICHKNSQNFSDFDYNLTAINADGIYLAVYKTFLLSLTLMRLGHYSKTDGEVLLPLTEEQFVQYVQNSGLLVYLTNAWLKELYQCILASNPLGSLENIEDSTEHRYVLIDMIDDIGNNQILSEFSRLKTVTKINPKKENIKQTAAKKLARRLLTCCWDSMVTILSSGLEIHDSKAARLLKLSKKTLMSKKKKPSGELLYSMCLDGLKEAAVLSSELSLQHLAGKILTLMAKNVCVTGPKVSFTKCQALTIEIILKEGLELGSKGSSDCWLPIISVCRHVNHLDDFFSSQNASKSAFNTSSTIKSNNDSNVASVDDDEDETCVDVYSFLQSPMQNADISISDILKNVSNQTGVLSQKDTGLILSQLSQLSENLFKSSCEQLSLPSLLNFLKCLCKLSRDQLNSNAFKGKPGKKNWWINWKMKENNLPLSLLFHRVGEITLKIFRSGRPLLHILRVWSITGHFLMDAASHSQRLISKRAIEYIHDIITSSLVEQSELPYYHFNEALLKPFEHLLGMETDLDVKDQIVGCILEIVETHKMEIRSGWRNLFGSLRFAIKTTNQQISNVIDIFRVFLESDNTLVFSNAGLDCILCLLEMTLSDDNNNKNTEFLNEILQFLERCASILSFMHGMSKCPNLHSTYKIKGISYTHLVDANIPNSMEKLEYFGNDHLQTASEEFTISYRSLNIEKDKILKLEELDKSGVLKVYFLLLDGLTNSLIVCPFSHQSPIIHTIFKLFKSLLEDSLIDFGFYSINHLLIPMLQDWVRVINKTTKNWYLVEKNFKFVCMCLTELLVEFIEKSRMIVKSVKIEKDTKRSKFNTMKLNNSKYTDESTTIKNENEEFETETPKLTISSNLALKQLFIVLVEISAQPNEKISRVGVSCMKHLIFSLSNGFNAEQWEIASSAIHRASTVNLSRLRQLSIAFYENSNSFYGDLADIKITSRKDYASDDINRIEFNRIQSLSQNVFLLDEQHQTLNPKNNENQIQEERNYSFLLYANTNGKLSDPSSESETVLRLSWQSIVVGLLSGQMLLQLIAQILLGSLKNSPIQSYVSCIYDYYMSSSAKLLNDKFGLPYRSRSILYKCLHLFLNSSLEFDNRPGLKFLIQKVGGLEFAANLYKQLTSGFIIQFMSLADSYLSDIESLDLRINDLKYIIESCNKSEDIKQKEFFVKNMYILKDLLQLIADRFLLSKVSTSSVNIFENKLEFDEDMPVENLQISPNEENLANEINKRSSYFSYISPQIEKDRIESIKKDRIYQNKTLENLLIACHELLRLLPNDSADKLYLLFISPKIQLAFDEIQRQGKTN